MNAQHGPVLGTFQGFSDRPHLIHAWIEREGKRYKFDHVVLRRPETRFPLLPDQILVEPGILYRRVF
jgi:hypothetical protein